MRDWLKTDCGTEVGVLLLVYFGAAFIIASYSPADVVDWLTTGPVIVILARAFGTNGGGKKDRPE